MFNLMCGICAQLVTSEKRKVKVTKLRKKMPKYTTQLQFRNHRGENSNNGQQNKFNNVFLLFLSNYDKCALFSAVFQICN